MEKGLGVKKTKERSLPGMYLDGEKVPWPKGDGQGREGSGGVQVVFVWL